MQHITTMLHGVATCVKRVGQTLAAFLTISTQKVDVYVPQTLGTQQLDLARML